MELSGRSAPNKDKKKRAWLCREPGIYGFTLIMANAGGQVRDEELLRRMLAGDGDAFEALYDRRQAGVYRFALRMSGSAEIAEDVTHDVFIALMRDGGQFDPSRGNVAGYLLGIARHRVLRRLRRERSFISMTEDVEERGESLLDEQLIADADPFVDLTRSETVELVRQAVLALPEHYREVVALCSLGEMSYEQAADVIGCPVGTIRSRLNRARGVLVKKLSVMKGAAANSVAVGQ
jgi:RNA polymerase sigma-70 factor (ECF subfamily)